MSESAYRTVETGRTPSRSTCECCDTPLPDDGMSRSVCPPCYDLHGYTDYVGCRHVTDVILPALNAAMGVCGSSYQLSEVTHTHACGDMPRHEGWHVCGVGACEIAWEQSTSQKARAREKHDV